ncbi:MAG TPA: TonB-dependent receptor plug domain-containing protein, partial [Chitinophagaceae bacterium]|nr:TonB-dependent receptor plug domain-containing protein [Chitinophagaceae bacterium]
GESLVGATVNVEGIRSKAIVKLDGTYSFAMLPEGTYKLRVTYLGYGVASNEATVTVTRGDSKTIDFRLEPQAMELSSVTVSAGATGEHGAMRLERIADPIVNVMSAKTIQLLPDITVANALQRVSGVTIERSSTGEGRYPIIRGMEKRYINTLVNGIKIPSPDNKNRYIPLDLFPAELLERLEVSKSLTPSMEGDAIGGTINLVMKDAPAQLLLQGNLALGYSSILGDQHYEKFYKGGISKLSPNEIKGSNTYTSVPSDFSVGHLNYHSKDPINTLNTTAGLTVGNRFGTHRQFGFVVSGSYQDIYRGTNSTFFLPNAQPGVNNTPSFVELQARRYSSESKRTGLTGKLDYQLNKNNK